MIATVAIVVTLAALAIGAVGTARQKAKVAGCLSNLRQIGVAAQMYVADSNGRLPQSDHEGDSWAYVARRYLGTAKCNRSPLDPNRFRTYSYAVNDYLLANPTGDESPDYDPMTGPGFFLVQRVPKPAETLYLALSQTNALAMDHFHFVVSGYTKAKFSSQVWCDVGDGASQYLFVDGHAERRTWQEVQAALSTKGSRFVRPDGHP